jgi:hypothetical protein
MRAPRSGVDGLLEKITKPVSDEEAQALLDPFGPDDCFGMAWTVLHMIETAPSSSTAEYFRRLTAILSVRARLACAGRVTRVGLSAVS